MILADNINRAKILKPLFVSLALFFSVLSYSFFYNNSEPKHNKSPFTYINGKTMGTTYSVSFRELISNSEVIKSDIDSILAIINNSMSTYIDNSEISTFNNLEKNINMKISEHFHYVLKKAYYYNYLSNQKFDSTVGPLYELWGFNGNRILDEPIQSDIDEVKLIVGMDKIVMNLQDSTNLDFSIYKITNGVNVDFNAIAKGYAVDVISEYLSELGYLDHFVEIGGEIRTVSNSDPWSVGIQDPYTLGNSLVNINLLDKSVATSGNYINYIEYMDTESIKTHIINPITGYPLDVKSGMISSATVISDKCIDADALATTLMLLTVDEAISFIDKLEDSEAFIVYLKDSILETRETLGFSRFRN